MTRAVASQAQVAYVAETVDGTTPTTPAFQLFRASGEDLEVMRKLVYSGELNGLRGSKNYAVAGKSGGGSFSCEFTYGSLDDMIEAALRGTWATNVVTNANTQKTFTLETKFETGATDIYKRLTGAQVDTLSLECKAQEIVKAKIGFKSRLADYVNAGVAGATYNAVNSEPIMTGDKVGTITSSGLAYDCVHTITLNINNNLRERLALGQLEAAELAAGDLDVTGTLGLYLSDTEYDVLTGYQAGTSTSLSFRINGGTGKSIQFSMPNIVLDDPKPVAESKDGDVLLNLNFRALQATSLSGGIIQVTRGL